MKSILFVDDEVRILQGLKRLLRSMKNEWSMHFASSGPEALDHLRHNEVDVIVSDMRMPGMMGDEVLKHVKDEHPHIVRLILSGHTEKANAQRCLDVAHQFLSKPCDTHELRDTVERVWQFSHSLSGIAHTQLAGTIGALPAAPRIFDRLHQACTQDDASFEEVASIIEEDPSYAVKVLQLVNSSFFGLRREIQDVADAARHLGMDILRSLVLSEELCKSFKAQVADGFDLDDAQQHGLLASRLAPRFLQDHEMQKTARCAALIHDIGQTLLAYRAPDEYRQVVDSHAEGKARAEAERTIFDVTHAEIGAYLLGLWGLPTSIVEAVQFHHEPARTGLDGFGPAGAVHVASAFAHGDEALLDHEYLRAVGVDHRLNEWRAIYAEELSCLEQRAAA